PDAEHEVAVLLGTLRVEAVPAEPRAEVGDEDVLDARDLAATPRFRVLEDALADIQSVVVPLGLLGEVERLAVAEGPLALAATLGTRYGDGHIWNTRYEDWSSSSCRLMRSASVTRARRSRMVIWRSRYISCTAECACVRASSSN